MTYKTALHKNKATEIPILPLLQTYKSISAKCTGQGDHQDKAKPGHYK